MAQAINTEGGSDSNNNNESRNEPRENRRDDYDNSSSSVAPVESEEARKAREKAEADATAEADRIAKLRTFSTWRDANNQAINTQDEAFTRPASIANQIDTNTKATTASTSPNMTYSFLQNQVGTGVAISPTASTANINTNLHKSTDIQNIPEFSQYQISSSALNNATAGKTGATGVESTGNYGVSSAVLQAQQANAGAGAATTAGATSSLDAEAQKRLQQNQAGQISNELLAELQRKASGQGTSAAQAQLQSATDATIAQQQAAMASNKGQYNPALLRAITAESAKAQQTAANQSAQLKAQESAQAATTAAGLGTSLQGQNIQATQAQQQIDNDINKFNAGNEQDLIKMALQGQINLQAQGASDALTAKVETAKAQNNLMNNILSANASLTQQGLTNEVNTAMKNAEFANQMEQFKLGQDVDLAKFNANEVNTFAKIAQEATNQALLSKQQSLQQAGLNDQQIQAETAKFNAEQANYMKNANRELQAKLLSGDQQATQAYEQLKAAYKLQLQQQGMSVDQAEVGLQEAQKDRDANMQRIEAGLPSSTDKFMSFLGSALGAGATIAKAI